MNISADDVKRASELPPELHATVHDSWQALSAKVDMTALPEVAVRTLSKLLACSPFCTQLLLLKPQLLNELCESGGLKHIAVDSYATHAAEAIAGCQSIPELKQALRELRQRAMLLLAWRDLAELDDLTATLTGLSALADALVDAALSWLQLRHAERHGQPVDAQGQPINLIVLGMGKLGGNELNFSSDIDLIFAYREAGTTVGDRPISHEEYFRGLAQQLVQVLNEHTEHGFVFRVDTRLRPFGDSGPLVMHFAAMEQYYQTHGREWERYAWIKARPIAGDLPDGQMLLDSLRPFVYRRYLDYSVYDSLRDMKAMIERETVRKGMQANIKLGRGGIREVEFVAQVYQLIRGGQDRELQTRSLREVLSLLAQRQLLPEAAVTELDEGYVFLRRLENRLQAYADRQTHDLPRDEIHQAAIATAMGFADWESLAAKTAAVRDGVHQHFQRVFGQDEDSSDAKENALELLWMGRLDEAQALAALSAHGFDDAQGILQQLLTTQDSARLTNLGETSRRRVDECVPLLMQAAAQTEVPDVVLTRMLKLLLALAGRTTYIALLVENPAAIPQLARLCAASSWIAEQIVQHPALLDSLLDPRVLYAPPRRAELEQELSRQVAQINSADLETLMDNMRRFRQIAVLRVAAADVSDAVPLMVVSDHLTEIAEVVLEHALRATQMQLLAKHGRPIKSDGSEAGFVVIAYGKFGGIELGYGSDLDLVFIHDGQASATTDGERPVSHEVYFNRLGQRLIHFLSAFTPAGRAYEVDMRLRPNGESGLLVPGFEAFAAYQHKQAWTWEHQALVRARAVAGSTELSARFDELRREILGLERDPEQLRLEVVQMREKMRSSLEKRETGMLDLKQGRGGIADIEFITQYFVLRYTRAHSALATYTDNIRILESLGDSDLWPKADVRDMSEAYRRLRRRIHLQALQTETAIAPAALFKEEASLVTALWERYLEITTGK